MRSGAGIGFLIGLGLLCSCPGGASPASLASAFSEVYHALGPLLALHAEYVLVGALVRERPGLGSVCVDALAPFELLQGELLGGSGTADVEGGALLVRAREATGVLCARHEADLAFLAATPEVDPVWQSAVAEAGLFETVGEVEKGLNGALDRAVSVLGGADQWRFSVTFALRTLLLQEEAEELAPSLREILLGSERTAPPPGGLAEALMEDVLALASFCERELASAEMTEAREAAGRILSALLAGA